MVPGPVKKKYRFKTKPYRHQFDALKRLLSQESGGALLMEPRTGKSKTTIDYLGALCLRDGLDRAIIFAPNRVLGTWVSEIGIHSPLNIKVTVWDAPARKAGPPPAVSGYYDLEVLLINYDAFGTPGKKTASGRPSKASGRYKTRSLLRKWIDGKPCAGILDESHKIKSPSGRVSNFVVSMSEDFKYRLILTGTPVTKAKRSHDVYMQWKFLNPERFSHVPSVKEFKSHYGRWIEKNGYPQYLGPKNLDEMHALMAKDAIIVRREDCFDLPPREDLVRFVRLKGASKRAYDEMAEEMITELESGTLAEASIKIVQNLRLGQITSGFVTDDQGDMVRFGFEKADELKTIMADLLEKDEHLVVAARWVPDLELIEAMGRDMGYKVYSVRGGLKRAESDANIINFRKATEPSLMVLQPSAAALGIDLSTASTMVWYSHTPSWVDFTQTCDRIALSRNSTTFIHLVAESTIDEGMLETLRLDGDLSKAVLNNPAAMLKGHTLTVDSSSKLKMVK